MNEVLTLIEKLSATISPLILFFLGTNWLYRKLNARKIEADISKVQSDVSLIKNETLAKWQIAAERHLDESIRIKKELIKSEEYNAVLVKILVENNLTVPITK